MVSDHKTTYDLVPYATGARTSTYVGRLAVLGRLLGMQAAGPNGCRVLELGCGDGGNLLPMAVSLPGSEFVGVDLAGSAIERGRARGKQLDLSNVRLLRADIREAGPDLGKFDYVIAHGVYSWVAPEIRRALLQVIRERMRPHGLAFVSYNALPGDQIRGLVRQMMRMHTAGISDPQKKMEQARGLLALLARMPGAAGDVYGPLLRSQVGKALQSSNELLYHDDLADISQPFFFTEFMQAAQAEGLQFASEAVFHAMSVDSLPDDISPMLRHLGARDLIAKEQYLDFLLCRGFRETVLCHQEVVLDRGVDLERLRRFRFTSDARLAGEESGMATFEHSNGSVLKTEHPVAIAALNRLAEDTPLSVSFADLTAASGAAGAAVEEVVGEVLYRGFSVGLLELRLYEPPLLVDVGERPVASPWARLQAGTGRVANLYHEMINLDDRSRILLPLLDGTRTIPGLAAALGFDEVEVRKLTYDLARSALLLA